MSSRCRTTSNPPTLARPASGRMAVDRTRRRVDFPEPLRPAIIITAPFGTANVTPASAQRRP
jgi:hypothetical protein